MPSSACQELGITEGDIVEITGKRSTPAVAMAAYEEDEALDVVRLDGLQRGNAESGSGEHVTIKLAQSRPATRVVFAPAQREMRLQGPGQALKRNFFRRPLLAGDLVATTGQQPVQNMPSDLRQMLRAPAYALTQIRLSVVSTTPKGDAESEGKRLLLIVEQRGCLYCRDMHENTFPDPRVNAMLTDTYYPVQINLHGDIEIVDLDGEALSEKQAARKWGILFTPTMIFLPTEMDDTKSVAQQAVSVMPGAFSAGTTLDMMTWVAEQRYLDTSEEDFQRYHARQIRERDDGDTL